MCLYGSQYVCTIPKQIIGVSWLIFSQLVQAYMYGFFKNKRIVLYDTLIQQVWYIPFWKLIVIVSKRLSLNSLFW